MFVSHLSMSLLVAVLQRPEAGNFRQRTSFVLLAVTIIAPVSVMEQLLALTPRRIVLVARFPLLPRSLIVDANLIIGTPRPKILLWTACTTLDLEQLPVVRTSPSEALLLRAAITALLLVPLNLILRLPSYPTVLGVLTISSPISLGPVVKRLFLK